jgi:hypothetical protein
MSVHDLKAWAARADTFVGKPASTLRKLTPVHPVATLACKAAGELITQFGPAYANANVQALDQLLRADQITHKATIGS